MASALPDNFRQYGRCGRAAAFTGRSRTIHLVCFGWTASTVLAQELCHYGHGFLFAPWVTGPGRFPVGHRHDPCHEGGPLPSISRPQRATWGPWLSHRWTGCPIAVLSGLLAAPEACVPEFGTLKITGRARGIQETSASRPLGNNPCYWTKETMCGFSCLSLPGCGV